MPLAPKLVATALVTATVATLSVLSAPAYADTGDAPAGGSSNVQQLANYVTATVLACRYATVSDVPVVDEVSVRYCPPILPLP